MKLDIDCVRDVLLEFETFPFGCYTAFSFEKSISNYGVDNVEYTLAKLKEAGYINAETLMRPDGHPEFLGIYDITYAGHNFLSTIREPSVWEKLKGAVLNGGTASVKVVGDIALELAKLAVSKKLGLQ